MYDKRTLHPFFRSAKKGKNPWWLYCIGLLTIGLFSIIGQIPTLVVAMLAANRKNHDQAEELLDSFQAGADWSVLDVDLNFGLFLILLSFAIGLIGIFIAIKLHGRSFKSLITPNPRIDFRKIAFGFFVWLLLSLLAEGISWFLHPEDYVWNFRWKPFLVLLLICISLLPLQTSFEELALRGYLMQGFGLVFRYPIVAVLATSFFFASLHLMNPEVAQYGRWTMLTYYSIAGIFLGLMTVMDDGLELALGVHFATNFVSAVFVSYEGAALQTPALFKMLNTDIQMMTGGFVVLAFIFLLLCAIKYKWPHPSYLFKKINYNEIYHS